MLDNFTNKNNSGELEQFIDNVFSINLMLDVKNGIKLNENPS